MHGELADDRLARPGRGGDQHPLTRFQGLACLYLERVQIELVHLAKGRKSRGLLGGADPECLVSLSW